MILNDSVDVTNVFFFCVVRVTIIIKLIIKLPLGFKTHMHAVISNIKWSNYIALGIIIF
jgi:hypothetical protein